MCSVWLQAHTFLYYWQNINFSFHQKLSKDYFNHGPWYAKVLTCQLSNNFHIFHYTFSNICLNCSPTLLYIFLQFSQNWWMPKLIKDWWVMALVCQGSTACIKKKCILRYFKFILRSQCQGWQVYGRVVFTSGYNR